jgi:hypothetical protein
MDAHQLSSLAAKLHERLDRYAYMVGVKDSATTPRLVVYVLKETRVPGRAIPKSYEGVDVTVARLERPRTA